MSKKSDPQTKAFLRAAAGYEFADEKLKPFTAQRQAAAAGMGLRFGLVDESDIFTITVETLKGKKKEKQGLQFYNQMFADVITVLWLCTATESEVLRALRKPDETKTIAFKWADEQGISLTSTRYYEAAGVFFQMMQDITVSTVIPKPESGPGSESEEDDPND